MKENGEEDAAEKDNLALNIFPHWMRFFELKIDIAHHKFHNN